MASMAYGASPETRDCSTAHHQSKALANVDSRETVTPPASPIYTYPNPVQPLLHTLRKERLESVKEIRASLLLSFLRFQSFTGCQGESVLTELNDMAYALDEANWQMDVHD